MAPKPVPGEADVEIITPGATAPGQVQTKDRPNFMYSLLVGATVGYSAYTLWRIMKERKKEAATTEYWRNVANMVNQKHKGITERYKKHVDDQQKQITKMATLIKQMRVAENKKHKAQTALSPIQEGDEEAGSETMVRRTPSPTPVASPTVNVVTFQDGADVDDIEVHLDAPPAPVRKTRARGTRGGAKKQARRRSARRLVAEPDVDAAAGAAAAVSQEASPSTAVDVETAHDEDTTGDTEEL